MWSGRGHRVAGCSRTLTTWATNPVTRRPGVVASALSTVDALSGHRTVCTIATGDSGVYNLGQRAAGWHLRGTIASTRAQAVRELRSPPAGHDRYSLAHHEEHGPTLRNGPLLEELGLLDCALERFGVAGTPDDWVARVRELRGRGVHQLAVSALMEDRAGFLDSLGRDVLAPLGFARTAG